MNLQEFAKEILPVVQAASEGRLIERRFRDRRLNDPWVPSTFVRFTNGFEYRIKPEPKLRPYTREEWENVVRVRSKAHGASMLVTEIHDGEVYIGKANGISFEEALRRYVNTDGSPCGVEVDPCKSE